MADIVNAIEERAQNLDVRMVYLATDGWMQGALDNSLVTMTVTNLRERGLTVVGLWKVPGLSNFRDGTFFDHVQNFGHTNHVCSHLLMMR